MSTIYFNNKYYRVRDLYTIQDLSSVEIGDIISRDGADYIVYERRGCWFLIRNLHSGELCMLGNPIHVAPTSNQRAMQILFCH